MGISLVKRKRYGECKACGTRVYTPEQVEAHTEACEKLRELEATGAVGWRTGQETEASILSPITDG